VAALLYGHDVERYDGLCTTIVPSDLDFDPVFRDILAPSEVDHSCHSKNKQSGSSWYGCYTMKERISAASDVVTSTA
jgi:hypothetical protein